MASDRTRPHSALPALRAEGLTLGYAEQAVVSALDVAVQPGRITALVGANGSGKSTLLKGLARLLTPRAGAVYLEGEAIARLPTKAVARRLSMLPQLTTAPDELTVQELVAHGRYPHQGWLSQWSREDERMTAWALAQTHLTELAQRPLAALSGGQRQRAWIAMALAQGTRTLLLDEPTTYLDMAHQVEVLDLLATLQRTEGRTIVMVLHDLNQAARYAHHVIALREGRLATQGPPAAVVTESVVREVFGLDCRVVTDPVAGTPLCVPVSRHGPSATPEGCTDPAPAPPTAGAAPTLSPEEA